MEDQKWIKRFMHLTSEIAKWSKDPSRKIGAIIVGNYKQIISQGYNGFPRGVNDSDERYQDRETKYKFVVHAEMNAILSAKGRDLTGCSIYITSSPCNECMKAIIQSGITRVVYRCAYGEGTPSWFASNKMAEAAGISVEKYNSEHQEINLGFL